ncbi:hypothetical protein K1T71_010572 [Dendrolimus kikuchii]|uniref:Uncharacterized protein n=1 Tax=Dendrolimus kikuchii TaxID=765133 RepID=A0ACC1CPB7_9NEOP|nr:hypothetical protein K1T71_010572 [Dendrolimus kikuchii]
MDWIFLLLRHVGIVIEEFSFRRYNDISPEEYMEGCFKELSSQQIYIQIRQSVFRLDHNSEDLIKDPTFSMLCQNFKKHARALEVGEAIEATKVLSYLQVPVDSLIMQTMLQMVRCNINFMNVRQIMFFHFILSRFEKRNHLVDALKLALPLAFQIHLPLELDNQDLPLLRDMLVYCCTNDLPDRCINNVVTGLLLHDQAIDAQYAKSIIWSLSQVNCDDRFPTRVQLLHICYDILTQCIDQLSYDDVLRVAARIKRKVVEKHQEYYHEQLMDAIAGYVVKNDMDFEKGLLVARVLSRIAHTNLSLIEHLCYQAASNPDALANARVNIVFGFVNCLSNNNYTPNADQWTEICRQISINPILDSNTFALPWTKFCLELASLGFYSDKLLDKIFTQEFLDDFLAREANTLDYLQLLTLHEAVNTFHSEEYKLPQEILEKAKSVYPLSPLSEELEKYLALGLGGSEYVIRNVVLPCGILADVFICLKGGFPVELHADVKSGLKVPIEHLNLPPGSVPVCLLNFKQSCFSMNSNRLRGIFRLVLDIVDRQGYASVAINTTEWVNSPQHERTPYLMREVGYKCGEIGLKLSAT